MAVLGFLLLLAEANTKMIRKPNAWVLVISLLIGVSYTAKSVQRIPKMAKR